MNEHNAHPVFAEFAKVVDARKEGYERGLKRGRWQGFFLGWIVMSIIMGVYFTRMGG